ncbi:MAG: hypothetical protein LBC89_01520 [Bacteroidales bacterium]|jgi:hypothetical protein|nr:hypothetical protein [Bacteroidales bacterium]
MYKSFKLWREENAKKLRTKKYAIRFGIFIGIFVSVLGVPLTIFLPQTENFWIDALIEAGVLTVCAIVGCVLFFLITKKKDDSVN